MEHWLQDGVYAGRPVWSRALGVGWGACGEAVMEWSIGCRMGCMRGGWDGVEHWLQDGVHAGRLVRSGALVAGWGVWEQASME